MDNDSLHKLQQEIKKYRKELAKCKHTNDTIFKRHQKLNDIIEALPYPFYVIDIKSYKIKVANKATLQGATPENQTCYTLTHKRNSPCIGSSEHPCPLVQVKKTKKPAIVEHIHYDEDGEPRNVEVYGYPIFDDDGQVIEMIEFSMDITKRKQAEQKLAYMATHDPLTNLPNRSLFKIRLDLEMSHAQRNKKKLAVMMLDLDRFKEVNDNHGHSMGDKLLQDVGNLLQKQVRKSDTLARFGGDEFMILLPEIDLDQDAATLAQKFVDAFQKPFNIEKHKFQISTSLGYSIYPDDAEDAESLIKYADIAMYDAKKQEGDGYQRYKLYAGRQ